MPPDFDQFGRRLVKHGPKGQPAQRRKILLETLEFFADQQTRDLVLQTALDNVTQWRLVNGAVEAPGPTFMEKVAVIDGDWGVVAHDLTQTHGVMFAVLNMANAFVPGGGYVEGMPAQEENLFRRTDCHFSITANEFSRDKNRYLPKTTDLINARHGRVSLDMKRPRVCVRGPEKATHNELGYEWLDKEEVFPFYELKAAAVDLRNNREFDENELARRIRAQLDTLVENKQRHVVLSAFGCGAFRNPAVAVARQYRIAIEERLEYFDCITFAIHHPGYGPNNFLPFKKILSGESLNMEVTQEISPLSAEDEPDFYADEKEEHSVSENNDEPSIVGERGGGGHSGSVSSVGVGVGGGVGNGVSVSVSDSGGNGSSSNGQQGDGRHSNDSRNSNESQSSESGKRNSSAWAAVRASILGFAMAKKGLRSTRNSNSVNSNNSEEASDKKQQQQQPAGTIRGECQWYWQTRQGWTAYDEQANALLERGVSQKVVKLSPVYYVDIAQMKQFRNDDKTKWRRVKREPKA